MADDVLDLRRREYDLRTGVDRLRRAAYEADQPEAVEALAVAEQELAEVAAQLRTAEARAGAGQVLTTAGPGRTLGAETTGLEATVKLRMSHVPTAICHLLDAKTHPLISCDVSRVRQESRRLRVSCEVLGYSAPAVDTVELDQARRRHEFTLLPTFYPDLLHPVAELTRATLSVIVADLDAERVELQRTHPIWLLARTAAVLAVRDPASGRLLDLSPYLGAFVTPNDPEVIGFLRRVADRHPERRLVGYQGAEDVVEPQVRAVFEALKQDAQITYVNSVIAFTPDEGGAGQRIRLPRESLADRSANCIDGTVLVASLLEAMSLRPTLVLVPGHAFVGWETWPDSGQWRYLETTMIGTYDYDAARQRAEQLAGGYAERARAMGDDTLFRRWSVPDLRVKRGITPMV